MNVHWLAALRVLTYLNSRPAPELTYIPNVKVPFEIYVDSNWEANRSISVFDLLAIERKRRTLTNSFTPSQGPALVSVGTSVLVSLESARKRHRQDGFTCREVLVFDLLTIGRVVPRYGERLIRKWREVGNQT